MAAISPFRVTQHSQIFFHFSLEVEFNALLFINYTIPRLCSTYAVATIIPLSKNLNYYQEDLIDSEALKSRKINSQTLSKGLWKNLENIVVSGFRIVHLEFLLFQFMKGCQIARRIFPSAILRKKLNVVLPIFGTSNVENKYNKYNYADITSIQCTLIYSSKC